VQIGHPIHEKQVLEAVLQARDEGLYTAITDCGAGGLSSAIGEMARSSARGAAGRRAAQIPGLRPWEIWLSEAQERMVLAVPPACASSALVASWALPTPVPATPLCWFPSTRCGER
jgi:phosphoribosylformylglycinamidine (FGAM) synthase-like enzyme